MVNPAPAPSSRAAEALDALIRERERRPLFRRRDPHDPFARHDPFAGPEPTPDRPSFEPLASDGPGADAPSSLVAVDEPYAADTGALARDAGSGVRDGRRGPARGPRDPRDLRALLELDPRRVSRTWARAVVAAVVVLVVVVGLVGRRVLARPAALDERLPIATASAAPGAGGGPAAVPSTAGGGDASPAVAAGSSTTVVGAGPVFVHVAGAVASPGVVQLGPGARVVDAIGAAGGLRPDADADRVNLAAPLVDGSRVVVPTVGQEPATELSTVPPPSTGSSDSGAAAGEGPATPGAQGAAGSGAPVPLNSATAAQLDDLPGVGPSTAQAILEHREREGPFTSVEGLLDVRGIGEAKLEALRDLVTIG